MRKNGDMTSIEEFDVACGVDDALALMHGRRMSE